MLPVFACKNRVQRDYMIQSKPHSRTESAVSNVPADAWLGWWLGALHAAYHRARGAVTQSMGSVGQCSWTAAESGGGPDFFTDMQVHANELQFLTPPGNLLSCVYLGTWGMSKLENSLRNPCAALQVPSSLGCPASSHFLCLVPRLGFERDITHRGLHPALTGAWKSFCRADVIP